MNTREKVAQALKREPTLSERILATRLGISRSTVNHHKKALGIEDPKAEQDPVNYVTASSEYRFTNDLEAEFAAVTHLQTVEDVVQYFKIDLRVWDVVDCKIKYYEGFRKNVDKDVTYVDGVVTGHVRDRGDVTLVPMHSFRLHLKKRVKELTLEAIKDELKSVLKDYQWKPAPAVKAPKSKDEDTHLLELDLADMHIDKRSYLDDNTKEQMEAYVKQSVEKLLKQTEHYKINQIVLVAGNDFLNTNGQGATARGTKQDVIMSGKEAFKFGLMLKRWVIERLYQRSSNIHVVMPEGNHGPDEEFRIGVALEMLYEKQKSIQFYGLDQKRSYLKYGPTGFMYTHGDTEKLQKLPLIWLAESPDTVNSKFRIIKRGHMHKRDEVLFNSIQEDYGMIVETLRSLSVTDKWHRDQGYNSIRGAQAKVYNLVYGPAGQFEALL
jgi:hypothetical protein